MKNGQPSVWITGASQGIGAALAALFVKRGYHVYASARNIPALETLRDQLKPYGSLTPVPLDITQHTDVIAVMSQILKYDSIDIAVLNAGTYIHQPADRFEQHSVKAMMDLNLLGTASCLEVLLPDMLQRKSGQIAIVSSLAGYRGLPNASGYGASKAALINLAESLKLDLEPKGIDIRLINPGFVETPLTAKNKFPMPDIVSAETAAQIIYTGLQSSAFEIRFPRRFAWVMKFIKLLPYWLFFPAVRRATGKQHD